MRNNPTLEPPNPANSASLPWGGSPYNDFLSHSSGQRILTSAVEVKAIRAKHPNRALTITNSYNIYNGVICDLLGFAAAGHAKATLSPDSGENMIERTFIAPARRHDEDGGTFINDVKFAAYDYEYQGNTFLVYVVQCSQGVVMEMKMNFILSAPGSRKADGEGDEVADALVEAVTRWGQDSHEEVWVFDRGMWMKDKELFKSISEASWSDVILDEDKKQSVIDDVEGFFSSEARYREFQVPWKVVSFRITTPSRPSIPSNTQKADMNTERFDILWSTGKWKDNLHQSPHEQPRKAKKSHGGVALR